MMGYNPDNWEKNLMILLSIPVLFFLVIYFCYLSFSSATLTNICIDYDFNTDLNKYTIYCYENRNEEKCLQMVQENLNRPSGFMPYMYIYNTDCEFYCNLINSKSGECIINK